jgi:hydrogenase maturation protease
MLHEQELDARFTGELARFLRGRTCLLGIGSRWWHDDGAGSHVARALSSSKELDAIDAGFVPENFLETVARKHPDTILLVDTTDFGGTPGEVRLLHPDSVAPAGLSTHAGSLRMLARYLHARCAAPVAIVAIQPGDTGAGEGLTPKVALTVDALEQILPALCKPGREGIAS